MPMEGPKLRLHRLTDKEEDGITKSEVRPYIMDLGSTNGTYLNNERLDSERYYELLPKVTKRSNCLR